MSSRTRTALTWFLALLGALALTASAIVHTRAGAQDFSAYYSAVGRFLSGQAFYVDERIYAYKYAPITILYFLPFHFFDLGTARALFTLLQLAAVLACPFLLSRVLRAPTLGWGLFLGFLASLRFVDGEFRAGNCGIWVVFGCLVAALCLRNARSRFWGPLVQGLSVVVKVHALVSFVSFRWEKDRRTFLALGATALVLLFIPNPLLWPAWWTQLQETGKYAVFRDSDLNLQGFYAWGSRFLRWDPTSHRSLLLALPFGLWAFAKLPRFTLDEAGKHTGVFFLTISCWLLWASLSSPLPWQHTYSGMWVFFPLSWHYATRRERGLLAVIALVIALTPVDIIGRPLATPFESHQGIFACLLAFWILLVQQASRIAQRSTQ
ncbi:DUF2029 domain-containing protein [bacterium]|nr:DUF2029 domain-containing protein [bacterium]